MGCELVANPTDSTARSLHIRKADELVADGATWNFPNGWKGTLTARVMIRKGYQGGIICLNDRMFDPANDFGEEFAVFRTELGSDGRMADTVLEPGKWHDIALKWNLDVPECRLLIDGENAGVLNVRHQTLNGVSYVRFRSAARELDTAGFLVDSVNVSIDDPYAPRCGPKNQIEQEKRYVENVVPHWSKQ